jgi:hypothetical protein
MAGTKMKTAVVVGATILLVVEWKIDGQTEPGRQEMNYLSFFCSVGHLLMSDD